MSRLKKIGLPILISGIIMLFIEGSMFGYNEPRLNPIVNNLCGFSLIFCLPIIVGIAISTWPENEKNKLFCPKWYVVSNK